MNTNTNVATKEQIDLKQNMVTLQLDRYFKLSYQLDNKPEVLLAAKQEASTYHATMAQAKATNATLIYCSKTGQPIGQLFEHCIDQHLPSTIAPNWLNTSIEAVQAKLDKQPIALLVYLINRYAFKDTKARHQEHESNEGRALTSIELVNLDVQSKRDMYDTIISHDNITQVTGLLYAVSELTSFLEFSDLITTTIHEVYLTLCDNDFDTALQLVHKAYVPYCSALVKVNDLQASAILDDNAFVDYWSAIISRASNRITSTNNATLRAPKLVVTSNRKRSATTREQDIKNAAVDRVFAHSGIGDLLSNVNRVTVGPEIKVSHDEKSKTMPRQTANSLFNLLFNDK